MSTQTKLPKRQSGWNFVEQAARLDKLGHTDAALDLIYDRIDTLLIAHEFDEVDAILESADLKILSIDVLLGLLTSTLPARTKLASRKAFFMAIEQEAKRRGEWEQGLLTGLEN
jgi:hypothetical protein